MSYASQKIMISFKNEHTAVIKPNINFLIYYIIIQKYS